MATVCVLLWGQPGRAGTACLWGAAGGGPCACPMKGELGGWGGSQRLRLAEREGWKEAEASVPPQPGRCRQGAARGLS